MNNLVRAFFISSLIALVLVFLFESYGDEYVEVEGHTYESIFIQLNTYDDEALFNLASLAMVDGRVTKAESIAFFKYAMDNLSPITMAPTFRGESLVDSYPLEKYRSKLSGYFLTKIVKDNP